MPSPTPRKNPSGSISWRVNFRIDGKQAQETFSTEKAGASFGKLVDRVGGRAAREARLARESSRVGVPTLSEFIATYLDPDSGLLTGIEPGTRKGYQGIAERSIIPFLGEIPVDAIQKEDVGRWVAWQERQPSQKKPGAFVAAKTVENYRAFLFGAMKAATPKYRVDNPVDGVKNRAGEKREGVHLSQDEVKRIIAELRPHYRPFVSFLIATGCRWGEATAVTWADLRTVDGHPSIRINKAWKKSATGAPTLGPPKSKKSNRTIELWPSLVAELGERGAPGELIFPTGSGGHMWHGNFYNRQWAPAVRRAGVDSLPNPHDLRHTCACWLILDGKPLPDVQARMGHESILTTIAIYNHVTPRGQRAMSETMERALS